MKKYVIFIIYIEHIFVHAGENAEKKEVILFEMKLAENLTKLKEQLIQEKYHMHGYYHFVIKEPKERQVFAAHYIDRVLLHCICDEVLCPRISRRLIYDNAACQPNKGTHFAIRRFSKFLQEHYRKYGRECYVLKCDIAKYFASVDHEVLKKQLDKIIYDPRMRKLIHAYIDSYETKGYKGIGLPLGNQSSQWFAINYLDPLDRYIKEQLRIRYYVRYMDDFLLVHYDREYLKDCLEKIMFVVEKDLRLQLHDKSQICSIAQGIEFLGWKFYLTKTGKVIRKMRSQSKLRFKRRWKKLQKNFAESKITVKDINASIASYQGHLKHGHTYLLVKQVYETSLFMRK